MVLAAGALALSACDRGPDENPAATPAAEETDGAKRSIFRPEFQVEPIEVADDPVPLETRVYFPEGTELTEEATAELATVLASQQARGSGSIVLGGHSDSGGDDEANMRASRVRAEAVRDWLIENGIAEERITIIAFGEQNPIEPNALPDGSPNEEGRASNRRVEILVRANGEQAQPEEPTLAESLASPTATADRPVSSEND